MRPELTLQKLPIAIIQSISGKPITKLLSDCTGISEKTWKKGGPKRAKTRERAAQKMMLMARNNYTKAGLPEAEIESYFEKLPISTNETPWAFCGLVHMIKTFEYPGAGLLEFATKIDELTHQLIQANQEENFTEFKRILLETPWLEPAYFADSVYDPNIPGDDMPLLRQIREATDWPMLEQAEKVLASHVLFSLLACWDIEFAEFYFPGFEPLPLFELLMVKTTWDFETPEVPINRKTLFRPERRLLDLMAFLGGTRRNNFKWLKKPPSVKEMAVWLETADSQITEEKLWQWRDGRDDLSWDNFNAMWYRLCGVDDKNPKFKSPSSPWPWFIATKIWSGFIREEIVKTRMEGKVKYKREKKSILFFHDLYLYWWEFHKRRVASDPREVTERWPDWIKCQSSWPGCKSSASRLSPQSSGRSSKPRDSQ